jgi:hypothetical protein
MLNPSCNSIINREKRTLCRAGVETAGCGVLSLGLAAATEALYSSAVRGRTRLEKTEEEVRGFVAERAKKLSKEVGTTGMLTKHVQFLLSPP